MLIGETVRIALQSIRGNLFRAALTMLGIVIGVGAVMTMVALGTGAQRAIDAQMQALGGDNLAATFSPELADLTIYVIDVAEGEKIPRKGGPGITRSDLLVINKVDLAPYVGASLEVMESDTRRMRGDRPWVFANMKTGDGLDLVKASRALAPVAVLMIVMMALSRMYLGLHFAGDVIGGWLLVQLFSVFSSNDPPAAVAGREPVPRGRDHRDPG